MPTSRPTGRPRRRRRARHGTGPAPGAGAGPCSCHRPVGQPLAGHAEELEELSRHGQPPVGYLDFVSSSAFLVAVAENWQSEFLQFFMFILATVWLVGENRLVPPCEEAVPWTR
ncbi:DUF6766 family protein [Promicromonospora sp. NPDC019610]|uniref:DUF6766 family protein n=1 Tax=Promicromonospora sp. NPDC019610 TaxID=3364405 RepID=UPI0037893D9D